MIDLHCHLLPQIDDGSKSLDESLAMARIAVADGVRIVACTPHILPGIYENSGPAIRQAVAQLQGRLDEEGIPLLLAAGADVHIAPDLIDGLRGGRVPSLGKSRYFLLEPPQGVIPPRFEDFIFNLMSVGYIPVITHPERLSWIESHYDLVGRIVHSGAWVQITAGSILGKFGRRARAWSERLLDDGFVHIVASDAHDTEVRTPKLSEAVEAIGARIGREEAWHLVVTRPTGILRNQDPSEMPVPVRFETAARRAWGS